MEFVWPVLLMIAVVMLIWKWQDASKWKSIAKGLEKENDELRSSPVLRDVLMYNPRTDDIMVAEAIRVKAWEDAVDKHIEGHQAHVKLAQGRDSEKLGPKTKARVNKAVKQTEKKKNVSRKTH